MAPRSAPLSSFGQTAILLPRLAEPGRARGPCRWNGRTCSRSDPQPSGWRRLRCQSRRPASSATSAFEDERLHSDEAPAAIDPFSARAIHSAHGCGFPCDPSAPFHNGARQMQRVPVYRLTFASSPCGRVRPGADELSVHPVAGEPDRHDPPQNPKRCFGAQTCRAGPDIGKAATAGPKPPPPFSRPTGEIAARPRR